MATLRKRPDSGRFYLQYTDAAGKQKRISLGTTDKQIAKPLFDTWEKQVGSKLRFQRLGLVAPAMRVEELWMPTLPRWRRLTGGPQR